MKSNNILLESLAAEEREKLIKELSVVSLDFNKQSGIFASYFDQDQKSNIYTQTLQNEITNWLQAIDKTLSNEQRVKLESIANELQSSTNSW